MQTVMFSIHATCGECGALGQPFMVLKDPLPAPVVAKTVHTCAGCGVEIEYSLVLQPRVLNRGLLTYATITADATP